MELAMNAVGAREGIVGIKAKNRHAVAAVEAACVVPPSASICWAITIRRATNTTWFTRPPAG